MTNREGMTFRLRRVPSGALLRKVVSCLLVMFSRVIHALDLSKEQDTDNYGIVLKVSWDSQESSIRPLQLEDILSRPITQAISIVGRTVSVTITPAAGEFTPEEQDQLTAALRSISYKSCDEDITEISGRDVPSQVGPERALHWWLIVGKGHSPRRNTAELFVILEYELEEHGFSIGE